MSTLRDTFEALRPLLEADARLAGVNISAHDGDFSLDDLERYSKNTPALIYTILGFKPVYEGGMFTSTAQWAAAALVEETPPVAGADLTGPRGLAVLALADRATRAIMSAFNGAGDGYTSLPRNFVALNEYSTELDQRGVALYALTWDQAIELVDEDFDALPDFDVAAVGIETYTRDTEDTGDVPEIIAIVEPNETYDMAFPTQHLNIGKIGASVVAAVPGTPDPDALGVFGQSHVARTLQVNNIHLHGIEDLGSGSITVEVFKRESGGMTLLGECTLTGGGGDYATGAITWDAGIGGVAPILSEGVYLMAQVSDFAGPGGYDGLTLDVHFD